MLRPLYCLKELQLLSVIYVSVVMCCSSPTWRAATLAGMPAPSDAAPQPLDHVLENRRTSAQHIGAWVTPARWPPRSPGDCWWWTVTALVDVVQQQVVPMILYCSSPCGCGVHITLHSILCVVNKCCF